MERVARREWVWALIVSGLVLAISTVPYLLGYLAQTPQERFGGVVMNPVDYHSHLAKMWQGYRGEWEYRLLFTSEEHEGVLVQTFYVALGHLARLFGLDLPLTYQLARVGLGLAMLLTIYRFVALFVAAVRTRQVAFLLATIASGLGWLTEVIAPTPPGGVSPMDFWLLDGFTYLAVLTSPHFCAAVALLLFIFLLLLRRPEGPSLAEIIAAVVASLALGVIHPYTMFLADLLPVLYWIIEWLQTRQVVKRCLAAAVAMGAAQIPLLAYDLWVFRQPVFAGWSEQNVTLSPSAQVYLWGYGVLLVLGAVGVVVWIRRRERRGAFPLLWIGLVAVLAYVPWNLQRRFLEGVQVPLGVLAGVGLVEGLLSDGEGQRQTRWQRPVRIAVIALVAMSNLYLTAGLTVAAASRAPVLFWSADLLAGLDWLGEHASWEETVLAGFETGNLIPARIGQKVVLGHWMETVSYEEKRAAVSKFFAVETPDVERLALLKELNVVWVFYGSEERALGGFDPTLVFWLEPVFHSDQVTIYHVRWEE